MVELYGGCSDLENLGVRGFLFTVNKHGLVKPQPRGRSAREEPGIGAAFVGAESFSAEPGPGHDLTSQGGGQPGLSSGRLAAPGSDTLVELGLYTEDTRGLVYLNNSMTFISEKSYFCPVWWGGGAWVACGLNI